MRGLMEKLTERLDLPAELLEGTARLTLTGGSAVRIENHRCLLSYSPDLLEVGCGTLRLRVRGEGLRIRCMDRTELLLTGKILGVEVDGA